MAGGDKANGGKAHPFLCRQRHSSETILGVRNIPKLQSFQSIAFSSGVRPSDGAAPVGEGIRRSP